MDLPTLKELIYDDSEQSRIDRLVKMAERGIENNVKCNKTELLQGETVSVRLFNTTDQDNRATAAAAIVCQMMDKHPDYSYELEWRTRLNMTFPMLHIKLRR